MATAGSSILSKSASDVDLKTRFLPGITHLTSTTYRTRRGKSVDQHTLRIENVPARAPRDVPDRVSVHPGRRPSSTYMVSTGEVVRTKFGGEATVQDAVQTWWECGEHWNRDSNIKRWTFQETRRNAAQSAHDVHRHEQVNHERLASDRENLVDPFKTWIPPRHNDDYDPKPLGARLSCGVHNQACSTLWDGEMVRPTAIYTKKFQKAGEDAFKKRGVYSF
ncbi:unnamed protein product [Amoebophrya sp. A25]|nr:unnamed protein product [Amoebophrya sp. A25]|eukprot:GSA25T00002936001.1